jgi:hypothetical protein
MKTKKYVYEHKAKPGEYLLALSYNIRYILLLNKQDKVYCPLVDWLINNELRLTDDEIDLPSIVNIAKEFGTDYHKITKWFKAIYNDIVDLNQKKPENFVLDGQILCELHFHAMGANTQFSVGLNVLPHKGDSISFDFINPLLGRWGYYVSDFYHTIENGKQKVHINLDDNEKENLLYYQIMKERAYLDGIITHEEFLGLKLSKSTRNITYQDIR